jgi:hypothetical protein
MAPVEPEVANSNTVPFALFSSQIASVGTLLLTIAIGLYRTSSALPPSQDTRLRQPKRKRSIAVFSTLSVLSFCVLAYFAVDRRIYSYRAWAQAEEQEATNRIWSGWYGTGKNGQLSLQLGRWLQDINPDKEAWEYAAKNSRSFWWTQQQYSGLLVWSTFVGLESKNLAASTSPVANQSQAGGVICPRL